MPVRLSGAVEKGPFLLGSSVSVTPADVQGAEVAGDQSDAPAGQVFKTETANDRGEFSLTVPYQGFATIEGTGYYYNEATGDLSSSPLTLRAFHEVGDTDDTAHVNLVTHLTYQRVQHLIADGVDAADAIGQAEDELHAELGLGAPQAAGSELTLTGGDNDDDAYLFAVSTVFAQAALLEARSASCGKNCVDAKLQELLNTASASFALAGAVPAAIKERLETARPTINNETVMAALADRLTATGSSVTVPDLNRVIPWEVPAAVTACAANVVPAVSTECKLAICGITQRPLDDLNRRYMQSWQDDIAECDDECWATIQCAMEVETCRVDGACSGAVAQCAVGRESHAPASNLMETWIAHVSQWADNGQCD